MYVELNDEQRMFRDSIERWRAGEYPLDKRRHIITQGHGYEARLWQSMAELGWLAAALPERYGGLDGSAVETMVLMEQIGRGLVVSPYFSSVVLGANLVLFAGTEKHKGEILPAVAEGACKLAFAYAESGSRYDLHDVTTRARRDGDDWVIDGAKGVVFHAASADRLIVSARTSGEQRDCDGISLFLVDAGADGLHARHYSTQDGGRASELVFENVRVACDALLGEQGAALAAMERTADHAGAALCAEASGAMWAVYEQTLEYHKTREQFGQTLGSFQALQHRMVDVYLKCELAQSMMHVATDALSMDDPVARSRAVSGARCEISSHARDVGQEGVQLHGGMGMTMELPIGHYMKRITMINATLGDGNWHLERFQRLGNRAA